MAAALQCSINIDGFRSTVAPGGYFTNINQAAAKFCSNLSTIYNKFYDKAFKLAFTISFSESWNFCAATPCKELMKTEDPEDSCEFDIQESMSASLLSVSNFF